MAKLDPRNCLILIVEDDITVADFFEQVLQTEGFKTTIVYDGPSALKKIFERKPSLILLDLMLPGIGGYEILRKIQTDHELSKVPIIIATAKELDTQAKHYMVEGTNVIEIMEKPVNPVLLLNKVHAGLNTITREDRLLSERSGNQSKEKLW